MQRICEVFKALPSAWITADLLIDTKKVYLVSLPPPPTRDSLNSPPNREFPPQNPQPQSPAQKRQPQLLAQNSQPRPSQSTHQIKAKHQAALVCVVTGPESIDATAMHGKPSSIASQRRRVWRCAWRAAFPQAGCTRGSVAGLRT